MKKRLFKVKRLYLDITLEWERDIMFFLIPFIAFGYLKGKLAIQWSFRITLGWGFGEISFDLFKERKVHKIILLN